MALPVILPVFIFVQDYPFRPNPSTLDPYGKGKLEERTVTVCSGLDFVNINYMHMVASSPEVAEVSSGLMFFIHLQVVLSVL